MTKVRTSQLAQTGAVTGQALVWNGTNWLPAAPLDPNAVPKGLVDAKGDLIVATAADTVARQPVGGDGTALVADSASATGVKWGIPDDATKIPRSIVDAAGDLIVGSGADSVARLAKGTDKQILKSDAAGLVWGTVHASEVPFTPYGTVAATNVQAAIEELSVEGGGSSTTSGHVIEDEGVALPNQPNLNFVGAGVTVSDDPANTETRVTIAGTTATEAAFVRQSISYTTASLATNASATALLALPLGYRLYTISTDREARIRLYENATKRDADLSRDRLTTPPANSGLMLDYVTETGALTATLSPLVDGFCQVVNEAGLTIENYGAAGTVTLTFTYKRTE